MNTTGQLFEKSNHRQIQNAINLCKKYLKNLSSDDVILDIGCGEITKYLAVKSGANVTGIDINPDMIEYARLNNNDTNKSYERVHAQTCNNQI